MKDNESNTTETLEFIGGPLCGQVIPTSPNAICIIIPANHGSYIVDDIDPNKIPQWIWEDNPD